MELRTATIADATAIVAFDHVAASEPSRVRFIHDQIKSSACYVAVIDANVVAYVVLNYKFYNNGWIEMLYVPSAIPASRNRICVGACLNLP